MLFLFQYAVGFVVFLTMCGIGGGLFGMSYRNESDHNSSVLKSNNASEIYNISTNNGTTIMIEQYINAGQYISTGQDMSTIPLSTTKTVTSRKTTENVQMVKSTMDICHENIDMTIFEASETGNLEVMTCILGKFVPLNDVI